MSSRSGGDVQSTESADLLFGRPVFSAFIALVPVPASRPRVTRWGTYYSATYRKWKEAAETFFAEAAELLEGPLEVIITVICPHPKTVKRAIPRGDVDNYAKAALDVVTKTKSAWLDDEQVVRLSVQKRFVYSDETPGTRIAVFHAN